MDQPKIRLASGLGPDQRRSRPILFGLLIAASLAWIVSAHRPGKHASPRVTLAELEKKTRNLPFLVYQGVEGDAHRFETPDGRTFFVDRSALAVPNAPPTAAGIGLFVKAESGRIRTLRREEYAALRDHLAWDHFSRDPDDTPEPSAHRLPVVRRVKSDHPSVLKLSSDGDWSNEDLGRLDRVLESWIRDGRQGLEPQESGPEAERPRLNYDQDESAGDRKTIVVRAHHFNDAWCESLAAWLGREYPFLWQLEVEQ